MPILKPENMGTAMAIDEKHINGKFYTILTNHQSGKIALMAATHRKADLDKIMQHFGDKRWEVKTLTRDLSNTYDWLGREHFLKAYHVADKFHIIRYLFDALHDVRIFYRQKLLTKKREQQERKLKKKRFYRYSRRNIIQWRYPRRTLSPKHSLTLQTRIRLEFFADKTSESTF